MFWRGLVLLTQQGGDSSPPSALQRAALVAVGASASKSLPPLGEGGAQRRMRARTIWGVDRGKSLPLGSPHPPQCAHWGTFPQWGKALDYRQPTASARSAAQEQKITQIGVTRIKSPIKSTSDHQILENDRRTDKSNHHGSALKRGGRRRHTRQSASLVQSPD